MMGCVSSAHDHFPSIPHRYLVASRDLKKGELLIEVDALIIGPCAESLPICLGCYVDLIMVPTQY